MPTISPKSIRTTRPTEATAPRKRKVARKRKTKKAPAPGILARLQAFDWRRRAPVFQWGLAFALFAGLGIGGWSLWTSDFVASGISSLDARFDAAADKGDLRIGLIEVTGQRYLSADAARAATGIEVGDSIMGADLDLVRDRVTALGWVSDAIVSRQLPGTLVIKVRERSPFALWQFGGRLRLIDETGAEITQSGIGRFAHLPLIVGAGAPHHADRLLQVLEREPVLAERIQAAVRIGNRRWDLHFENGIDVRLPEDGIGDAWQRLAALERESKILSRDVDVIDLRLKDRIAVRPAGEEKQGS